MSYIQFHCNLLPGDLSCRVGNFSFEFRSTQKQQILSDRWLYPTKAWARKSLIIKQRERKEMKINPSVLIPERIFLEAIYFEHSDENIETNTHTSVESKHFNSSFWMNRRKNKPVGWDMSYEIFFYALIANINIALFYLECCWKYVGAI